MKNIIKAILRIVRRFYGLFVSIIYEEPRRVLKATTKLDSRTIPPPRHRSPTEKEIFKSVSFEESLVPHILSYKSKGVHASIYWFKYKRDKYTIELLSRVLTDEVISLISDKLDQRHSISEWIVTFAPSTSFHRGEKGWDHNQDIFEEMKKSLNFSFQKIFGFSDKAIKSSKKLTKHDRQKLSSDKFLLLPEIKISPNSGLIIFDDVTTTGSTLKNLEKLARELNPKIILTIAIAH